jgi:MEMO1 family protein
MSMTRKPAVAGTFYERLPERLTAQVNHCFQANSRATERMPFIGAVVPHAGLMYSGHVAAAVYDLLALPPRLIILCPNHTGLGADAAIISSGGWLTPLGEMHVDEALAKELRSETRALTEDQTAHSREHSLEVQLPFLQTLAPSSRFVPICLGRSSYELCDEVGTAIARVIQRLGEPVGIIASSDLNHYENQESTLRKDQLAIDCILALDPRRLWETIHREEISMCGYIPTTTMLIAARELGASHATLVKHATSADVSGDYGHVVGYAGLVIQ